MWSPSVDVAPLAIWASFGDLASLAATAGTDSLPFLIVDVPEVKSGTAGSQNPSTSAMTGRQRSAKNRPRPRDDPALMPIPGVPGCSWERRRPACSAAETAAPQRRVDGLWCRRPACIGSRDGWPTRRVDGLWCRRPACSAAETAAPQRRVDGLWCRRPACIGRRDGSPTSRVDGLWCRRPACIGRRDGSPTRRVDGLWCRRPACIGSRDGWPTRRAIKARRASRPWRGSRRTRSSASRCGP